MTQAPDFSDQFSDQSSSAKSGAPLRQKTVLITGASAGIGAAFARVFAKAGYDLVLTARREQRLIDLGHSLKAEFDIHVTPICADLSHPDAPADLFRELELRQITIDALVNNAGYAVTGTLATNSWATHRDFIAVLMTACVHLSHLAEGHMLERGEGLIINVASLAGLTPPAAGHTLYNAAKSFLIKFSEAHAEEVGPKGIKVSAVCPGFTLSEFHDVSQTRHLVSQFPKAVWMSADEVAQSAFQAAKAGKTVFIPGLLNKTIAMAAKLLPRSVASSLTRSQSTKYRKTAN